MVTNAVQFSRLTDRSGTIIAGGTPQSLLLQDPGRYGWRIQNTSSGDLWFNDTKNPASVAGLGCFKVGPGDYYESPPNSEPEFAISLFGATTGQTFSASEW